MSLLDNFPHRCSIQRLARSGGTLGGGKSTPVVEQTDVECWQQQASNAETGKYQQRGMSLVSKIYFLTNPGVTTKHQILITEMEGVTIADPTPLDVLSKAAPDASAGAGIVWKIFAEEITAEGN